MNTLPGLPGLPTAEEHNGAREMVRVDLDIVHLPNVRLGACRCGAVHATNDEGMVAMARRGDALPPIECSCGRIIVAQKKLVVLPSLVMQ